MPNGLRASATSFTLGLPVLVSLTFGCAGEGAILAEQVRERATADGGVDEPSSGEGEGEFYEQVSEDYDALLQTFVEHAQFFCECETAATSGAAFDACVDEWVQAFPPPILACTKSLLGHSAVGAESLRCELENNLTYVACIQQENCFDFDHITVCETDRIIAGLDCPDVPYEVWADNEKMCWGRDAPPAFECESGEKIDPSLVCDFTDDCADGSDEAGPDCVDPHEGLDL